MRIGLLGGSFNPAHEGHRHIAELARHRLRLDQVWLMVSPGNPLKPARGMRSFAERLGSARRIANGRRVIATGIEASLGTRYTVDTVHALRRRFPCAHFVWLMGADILEELPRWQHWMSIARDVPFAVLPRPGYSLRALAGQAASRLGRARLPVRAHAVLARQRPPAWTFIPAPSNATSATAIRQAAKEQSHRQTSTNRIAADPARARRDAPQDAAAQTAETCARGR